MDFTNRFRLLTREIRPAVVLLTCIGMGRAQNSRALEMTTEVMRIEYCRADEDVGFMRVGIRLRFRNPNSGPLVIQRGAGLVRMVLVSRTEQDLLSGKYEHEYSFTTLSPEPANSRVATRGDAVVLEKQGTYEIERELKLPIWLSLGPGGTFGLSAGEHFISLILGMGPDHAPREGIRTRDERGLPVATMRSPPIRIEVDRAPPTQRCTAQQ
jgi:hypothetical protein